MSSEVVGNPRFGQVAAGRMSLRGLRRFQAIAGRFCAGADCVAAWGFLVRRVATLWCVWRPGCSAVFQRSCECLGGVICRVTGVFAPVAVVTGAGEAGVLTKFAGPESVRESALSGPRSAVGERRLDWGVAVVAGRSAATATPVESSDACSGRNSSAAGILAASTGTRRRTLRTRQATPVNGLFVFAEICLRAVIG